MRTCSTPSRSRARARRMDPASVAANATDANADEDSRDTSPIFAIAQASVAREGRRCRRSTGSRPRASEGAIFDQGVPQLPLEMDAGASSS